MENEIVNKLILKSGIIAKNYKFEQEIPKRPNPLKLSKWLSKDIEEVEKQIDLIEEEFKVKCTCEKGCSACCRQLIALSMSECLAIKPYIENLSKDEKDELKRKVLEQCNILEENNITYYFEAHKENKVKDGNRDKTYWEIKKSQTYERRNYADV